MAKVTNLSSENSAQTALAAPETLDIRQVVDQQLRSLQRFGLTVAPAGTGETFAFSTSEDPAAVAGLCGGQTRQNRQNPEKSHFSLSCEWCTEHRN